MRLKRHKAILLLLLLLLPPPLLWSHLLLALPLSLLRSRLERGVLVRLLTKRVRTAVSCIAPRPRVRRAGGRVGRLRGVLQRQSGRRPASQPRGSRERHEHYTTRSCLTWSDVWEETPGRTRSLLLCA